MINHDREESNGAVVPETLRIGILPDQDPETLQRRFAPLLKYLSAALQIPCELRIPESYEHLLELFHKGEIDLGYFGGYSFVNARQQDRAVPVVKPIIEAHGGNIEIESEGAQKGCTIIFTLPVQPDNEA